jgi:glycosyltransferase involved in cell wall biosynthesis
MGKKSLSICVITQQLGKIISGPGLHAFNLIKYLADEGHDVTVITTVSQAIPRIHGVTLELIPDPPFSRTQFRWLPLSIGFARKLRQLLKTQAFDLVHFTDAREAFFSKIDIPMVGNVNDTYAADVRSFRYYKKYFNDWFIRKIYYHFVHIFEAQGFRRINILISNSLFTTKVLLANYELDPARIRTCYKSIHAGKFIFPRVKKDNDMKARKARVLFVGGNMQRKGLATLIRAAGFLHPRNPDIEYWVVGSDPAQPRMERLCEEFGVRAEFKFWGWKSQSDLVQFYRDADIFVMPSITEAFGVVFLEAMASGLPVVGTNVGGIPEIIRHGCNGLLVPMDDHERLAVNIDRLINDADLYSSIREQGIKTARSFSVNRMMKCTYRIYAALLQA